MDCWEHKETVSDLEDLWCDIRTEKDKKWNKEWDCANEYWSPFARYVDDGGAAVSTYYRDYIDYHFFLVTMGPKYPFQTKMITKLLQCMSIFTFINMHNIKY
ncbi:MAG: hypothetical protein Ct9H90mP10_07100 [Actinomycetota bacterium]|nr:MAG: hypothetical protein Ct9H90mP10_07100 [Actinomycetota bacterium]